MSRLRSAKDVSHSCACSSAVFSLFFLPRLVPPPPPLPRPRPRRPFGGSPFWISGWRTSVPVRCWSKTSSSKPDPALSVPRSTLPLRT
eukprot:7066977-Alexandrium_andersonii.AAC.1